LPVRIDVMNKITNECFNDTTKIPNYIDKNSDMDLTKIKDFYQKELKKYWKAFNTTLKSVANKNIYKVVAKHYFVPYGIHESEVFMYADLIRKLYVYEKIVPYILDGSIFTPINLPYMISALSNELDSKPLEYK